MEVLAIASTSSDKYSKSSSTSSIKTVQIRDNGKSDILKSIEIASPSIREYMNSSQKYFEKFYTSESVPIPSTEQSSKQTEFLPKILTRADVKSRLLEFEKKYGINSEEFYYRWRQGKAVDSLDSLKWATMYEMWKEGYLIYV